MHPIETISNNKIKEITKLHQKKYREELGLYIIEGIKSVEEAINSNIELVEIYSTKQYEEINHKITIINENVMKKIATTSSPCEILAVAKKQNFDIKHILPKSKLILLDSISDPGNLGTIIRSATAFGIDGIILYGNCVDLYSSKVIRSATGNFFKLPIINLPEEKNLKEYFPKHKIIATALSENNNISLSECAKLDKYIVMFGSEAKGLSKKLISLSDNNIKLEMTNNVESLNLSICASIVLYELFTK